MESSQLALRLQCVNCNIRIETLRRHLVLNLDTRVISTICEWNPLIIITEEDYLGDACNQLAIQYVNSRLAGEPSASSSRGHIHVCTLCGCSLRNRKRDRIVRENPSRLQQSIHIEFENRIAPRQATSSDYVCHACWLRLKRAAMRNMQQDIEQAQSVPEPELEPELEPPPQEPQSPPNIEVHGDEATLISLPHYRRAANTATHCVFSGCQNRDLHRISDPLRATSLSQHKYYLPINARICIEHTFSTDWDMLYNSENSFSTFTAQQIEHAFSLINASNTFLDFSSMETIQRIDENLFHYWLGMSKAQFELIYETPRLIEAHGGILGLGALLMKMRTGDSDERLSQLLMVPRRTLERLMDSDRKILVQDIVPRNLGLQHISRQQLLQHNLMIPNAIYNENK